MIARQQPKVEPKKGPDKRTFSTSTWQISSRQRHHRILLHRNDSVYPTFAVRHHAGDSGVLSDGRHATLRDLLPNHWLIID
jgi:hypothetical protein